jgi:hypothetical protein
MLPIDKIEALTQKFKLCGKFIPGILTGNEIAEKVIAFAAKLQEEENKNIAAILKDKQELLTLDNKPIRLTYKNWIKVDEYQTKLISEISLDYKTGNLIVYSENEFIKLSANLF